MEELFRARNHRILGAFLAAATALGFALIYWNRFLALSCSGAGLYPAEQILGGRMPYRDFFLIIPPLSILKDAAIIRLFSHTLLALRLDGVLERVALCVLVYWWLSRFFRHTDSFLGVIVAVVFFASDPADALISYHHDAVFLAVLAGYCAHRFMTGESKAPRLAAFFSGLAAGGCMMTAQTVGGGITLSVPAVVFFVMCRRRQIEPGLQFVSWYAAGWLVLVGGILLWLQSQHALQSFLRCVFLSSSAKGATSHVFLRPFVDRSDTLIVVTVFLLILSLAMRSVGKPARESYVKLLVIFGAVLLMLVAAYTAATLNWHATQLSLHMELHLMAGTLAGSVLLGIYILFVETRGAPDLHSDGLLLLSAVSFTTAYTLSLSFAFYGPMVMPGMALVIAAMMHYFGRSAPLRILCTAACLLFVFVEVAMRIEIPFDWMLWQESSAVTAHYRSRYPLLSGLRISEPTGPIVDRITSLILANAPPGGTLFVYPYFPTLYSLTGLRPPTYGYLHYLDVAPTWLCERDARTLVQNPPSVLVRLVESEGQLQWSEWLYRDGKRSGTREIIAAMDRITPRYRLLETFAVPGYGATLQVLAIK